MQNILGGLSTAAGVVSGLGGLSGLSGAAGSFMSGMNPFGGFGVYRDGGLVYRGGGLADLEPEYYNMYER